MIRLIQHVRLEIVRTANSQLIELYWQLGAYMSDKIESAQWGDSVVQQLSEYIARTAPELKGFSAQNLWRMKQFYEAYRNADKKLSTLLREIEVVEYALSRSLSPTMVAEYKLCLPDKKLLQAKMREIEAE